MVGCETSSQIWFTLETFFASKTKAKSSQLRDQLKETKKGTLSLNDYLLKIKHTVDQLASVGTVLTESEHNDAIFDGLTADYDSFVVSIHSRKDDYIVEKVESLLLAHEMRLEKCVKETGTMSVNLVQNQNSGQGNKSSPMAYQSYQSSQGNSTNNKGMNKNKGNYRGKNQWQTNNRPQCQLCGRMGHLSGRCYGRFDQNFQGLGVQSNQAPQTSSGNFFPQLNSAPQQMQAQLASYMATPASVTDEHWFPDSGATNHVTADVQNLNMRTAYQGYQGGSNARDS